MLERAQRHGCHGNLISGCHLRRLGICDCQTGRHCSTDLPEAGWARSNKRGTLRGWLEKIPAFVLASISAAHKDNLLTPVIGRFILSGNAD